MFIPLLLLLFSDWNRQIIRRIKIVAFCGGHRSIAALQELCDRDASVARKLWAPAPPGGHSIGDGKQYGLHARDFLVPDLEQLSDHKSKRRIEGGHVDLAHGAIGQCHLRDSGVVEKDQGQHQAALLIHDRVSPFAHFRNDCGKSRYVELIPAALLSWVAASAATRHRSHADDRYRFNQTNNRPLLSGDLFL
jgi:hypothetical protein